MNRIHRSKQKKAGRMTRILCIILGSIFLGLGVIGVILPGIPGTPFLLISASLYVRSSTRLYNWLISHKIFGRHIRAFREHKAMTRKSKLLALASMWTAISLSAFVVFDPIIVKIALIAGGVVGTIVILRVPVLAGDASDVVISRMSEDAMRSQIQTPDGDVP